MPGAPVTSGKDHEQLRVGPLWSVCIHVVSAAFTKVTDEGESVVFGFLAFHAPT